MARLTALAVADEVAVWESLGFSVSADVVHIGGVAHVLGGDGRGVTAWAFDRDVGTVDGLPGFRFDGEADDAEHPNAVIALDHVVVTTPALDRTIEALVKAGLELRRVRDAGGGRRQAFFPVGPAIVEVVGGPANEGDGPARFWGLAFTVSDLDATASFLGDRLRPGKQAVQEGRRIATLDRSAGSSVAMAFMSPR